MATPRRKDPADYLDGKTLEHILSALSKASYYDITVHTPDDFRLVEEYFEIEIDADPDFLSRFTRIHECTLLLDSAEYQSMVISLCGVKDFARNTKQYTHSTENSNGELTIINLFRDVRRQAKKKVVVKRSPSKPTKSTLRPQQELTEEVEKVLNPEAAVKEIKRLEKQMKTAVEAEDYEAAAHLRNKINKLKEK